MALETWFEIPRAERTDFISEFILSNIPDSERKRAQIRVDSLLNHYAGFDRYALDILGHAVRGGRFDEFVTKLRKHYESNLRYITPSNERVRKHIAEVFFEQCYSELGQ